MNPLFAIRCSALLLAAAAAAQEAMPAVAGGVFPTTINAVPGDVDGGAGLWAAGATYKVSLHEGFTFYPVLGPAHAHNLPLRWTDTEVRFGEQPVALVRGDAPRVRGRRCEFDLGGVVEAYDVRAEGVEQTFTIQQRPAAPGDLVVMGRVSTPLVAAAVNDRHAAVRFCDQTGAPILDYGAATAIDAVGRRWPMTTTWNGTTMQLRLPAAQVAAATFPLLVDPLTTTLPLDAGGPGAGAVRDVAVHRSSRGGAHTLLTVYSRTSAANDVDFFAVLGNDGQGNQVPVYTDLSTTWSTQHGAVTFVGAAQKWLIAFEREFASNAGIRCVAVPETATAPVYAVSSVPQPSGYNCSRRPDVGGTVASSTSGTRALIAFQSDITNTKQDTDHTEAFACTIDLGQGNLPIGTPFVVGSSVGTRYDRHAVSVTRESLGGNSSWLVAYQQFDRNNANASWRVGVVRVTPTGSRYGPNIAFLPAGKHALTPHIAGLDGRYLLVHSWRTGSGTATAQDFGTSVDCMRIDWSDTATNPTFRPARTVDLGFSWDYRVGDVAIDTESRSHWAFVVEKQIVIGQPALGIVRVGGSGGTVEEDDLYRSSTRPGYAPALCFDEDHDQFDAAFAVDTPTPGVYARSLSYPSEARSLTYGISCGGNIATNHVPRCGDDLFAITLDSGVPQQGALIALSFAPAQVSLGFAGMPGCTLLVDAGGPYLGSYFTLTRLDGTAEFPIVLSDWPPLPIDFHAQWFVLQPNANSAGLVATRGIEVHVR